jgi:hypothetical protein
MANLESLSISYLVLLPYHQTRLTDATATKAFPKGAPYFYEHDIGIVSTGKETLSVHGIEVVVTTQIFDTVVWVADCRYTIPVTPDAEITLNNYELQQEIAKLCFAKMHVGQEEVHEEYTIILTQEKSENPDHFVDANARLFSHCIRGSYDKPLDKHEVESILSSRVRYSVSDVTVVDWNGAVVVSDDDDFQSEVDLFKIGNYQLMRYRMLDDQLEEKLQKLQNIVDKPKRSIFTNQEKSLQDIVSQRLSLLLNFEKLDQSILLIGDWYTAKLYQMIVTEFYINGWKTIVQNKLESLRSIHEVVTQNLTFSWRRLLDLTNMLGWFIMMVGYFILMFYDLSQR